MEINKQIKITNNPVQPERSKRENLDYCKEIEILHDLIQCIIDVHDNGYDMPKNIRTIERYLQDSKMRCSEHERKPREG